MISTTQAAAPLATKTPGANYSGSWELDSSLSENVDDKIRWLYTAARSEAIRQQSRREKSSARIPMIDPLGGAIGDVEAVIGLGRLAEIIAQASVLTISQTDKQIIIERNDDFALVCDRRSGTSGSDLGRQRCGWINDQLAFEILLPEGLRVVHLLTLSPAGDRLNIATTVRSSRTTQSFTLNRVYMPFEPLTDEYNCNYTLAKKTTCTIGSPGS